MSPRFTLLRPLGKGGMGDVWLVRDGDLGEEVVAKIVADDASGDRLALLQRECRHARRLVHPNIVQVFDFHRGDQHAFVTMAYVDGESFRRLLGRPTQEILRAVIPISEALTYAHGQGVVHRDLKPSNVMLDATGTPRLLDFGIAGLTKGTENLTLSGGGSRFHMSPQQLDDEPPESTDDIYGLGVLIYELISGRPPFWPEITDQDIRTRIPEPMVSSHAIPRRLASKVASMLAKAPADRPPDMATVQSSLVEIAAELDSDQRATMPELTAPPRLTPPPTLVVPPRPPDPVGTAPRQGGGHAKWITVAFFGILGILAVIVFVALPGWVQDRQASRVEIAGEVADAPTQDHENASEPFEDDVPQAAEPAFERQIPPEPDPSRQPEPADRAAATESGSPATSPRGRSPSPPKRAPAPAANATAAIGDFELAMSEGLAALDRGDHAAAREAFARAAALRPGSTQSADGLARAEAGARLATIHALRDQALAFETQEEWHAATQRYAAALELDPAVEFALDGRTRSQRRADLDDRLTFHLANPGRLSTGEVLQEASVILEQASEVDTAGPKLQLQKDKLSQAIAAFSTPITATLESDQLTQVVVYKVGRLGTFSRRALDLRPGTYTVVGSRQGYRDIRRQLVIEPGVKPQPLAIRCEERI